MGSVMSSSSHQQSEVSNDTSSTGPPPAYIRRAHHAGSWYADDPTVLREQLDGFLDVAAAANTTTPTPTHHSLRALIVPHAGYTYSGATAAYAYHALRTALKNSNHHHHQEIRHIIVLHPSHHVYVKDQCLVSNARVLQTPLGDLTVDTELREELVSHCGCGYMTQTMDEHEHSGELQYPYLAHILQQQQQQHITVTPILCGSLSTASETQWGRAFSTLLLARRPSVLTIVSTDFCHWGRRFGFTPTSSRTKRIPLYETIRLLDQQGMDLIQAQEPGAFATYLQDTQNTICGRHAVAVWMRACEAAQPNALSVAFLHYEQSSRVQSLNDSSVSYAAGAAYATTESISHDDVDGYR